MFSQRHCLADGLAAVVGGMLGSPAVAAYVESAAGVGNGGRSWLTGVVVATLFGLSPIVAPDRHLSGQATAPARVIVGVLMMESIRDLGRERPEEGFVAILILLVTVTTMDLMMGLATGCFAYSAIVLATRAWDRVTPMLLCIDVILIVYVVLMTEALQGGG